MDIVGALRTLVRVGETGSFSAVSREFGVTQPSVSRQIYALEQNLGVRLVQRSTRRILLTEEGRIVTEHAPDVMEALEATRAAVGSRRDVPSGCVRLAVTVALSLYLSSRLHVLLEQYPELSLELITAEEMPDLVKAGLDLALRYGETPEAMGTSLITRWLGSTKALVLASPGYVAKNMTCRSLPLI